MKFLGASIFKSDGFHIFCYISVDYFFLCEEKPEDMLYQRKGKSVLS